MSVGNRSNDAMVMIKPKNIAALAGNLIFQSGISTTSYWVLTMDQSWFRLAERIMLSARLEAITPFEAEFATSATSTNTAVALVPNYIWVGSLKETTLFFGSTFPSVSKKKKLPTNVASKKSGKPVFELTWIALVKFS